MAKNMFWLFIDGQVTDLQSTISKKSAHPCRDSQNVRIPPPRAPEHDPRGRRSSVSSYSDRFACPSLFRRQRHSCNEIGEGFPRAERNARSLSVMFTAARGPERSEAILAAVWWAPQCACARFARRQQPIEACSDHQKKVRMAAVLSAPRPVLRAADVVPGAA